MIRHARCTLSDEQLDELHTLKRRLARERGTRVTLDDLLREGAEMVLRFHLALAEKPLGAEKPVGEEKPAA